MMTGSLPLLMALAVYAASLAKPAGTGVPLGMVTTRRPDPSRLLALGTRPVTRVRVLRVHTVCRATVRHVLLYQYTLMEVASPKDPVPPTQHMSDRARHVHRDTST